jgi:hypothetical protein
MSSSQPQVGHQMAVDSSEDILWCGLTNDPYCKIEPKHVHLTPLATKNWNLFFRIHLSAEIESLYFKFILTEFIDYEHARSSPSTGDQNHVRTIINVGSLEKFLNQGGIFQRKPAESLRSCKYASKSISHILSLR